MHSNSDPLRRRSYLHFDEPPARKDIERWVSDPERVARWQFLPLLSLIIKTKKVKTKDKKSRKFEIKSKERLICYASHRDAALYGHYASILSERYESLLLAEELSDAVTAFRPASGRCNIHFAAEVFDWILKNRPCVALAYDISGFFDNLDHSVLKKKLCEVLSVESLPKDFYAIFRSITRFVIVDRNAVYNKFGISKHNSRSGGRTRICSAEEFRDTVVSEGFLHKNSKVFGIPQGTPISALLSNLYLLDFDRSVQAQVVAWGGIYRRYCDDILCVVPPEHEGAAKMLIETEISKVKLKAQPDKQGRFLFDLSGLVINPSLQYLGLIFDGASVLLRTGGVARFYSRMRGGVRAAVASRNRIAKEAGVSPKEVAIRTGKLMSNYSYSGKRNFITYAIRAAKIVDSPKIKRQVSRHLPAIRAAISREDKSSDET